MARGTVMTESGSHVLPFSSRTRCCKIAVADTGLTFAPYTYHPTIGFVVPYHPLQDSRAMLIYIDRIPHFCLVCLVAHSTLVLFGLS